jgi:hypothetical protein
MDLKKELTKVFDDTLSTNGDIQEVARLLVQLYKKFVESITDVFNNNITGVNYKLIETAIISQFELSFKTKTFLQFSLIDASLVLASKSSTIKFPIKPPVGFSLVNSTVHVSSLPSAVTPLVVATNSTDNIVNKFFQLFTIHAKSMVFSYIGITPNGVPIAITTTNFQIK